MNDTALQIGLLHPGAMGAAVAGELTGKGYGVLWASEGRSNATRDRAERNGLTDVVALEAVCGRVGVVLSICPPHAAEDVAAQVRAAGFRGVFAECNAIAPERAKRVAAAMEAAGIAFVDGCIVGGPPRDGRGPALYLAGNRTDEIAALFEQTSVRCRILGSEPGKASALKMCYAANSKGTSGLIAAILAVAEFHGVREDLEQQWGLEAVTTHHRRVSGSSRKAWRFAGEMEEIAATFRDAGMPDGFHEAAAEVFRRLTPFRDAPAEGGIEELIAAMLPSR